MAEPSRIKEIPENEMTAEQRKLLADLVAGRGKVLTPYKIWIHSPKLAAALETIGTFLNKAGSLSEREVELIICIIANHWKGEYVWAAHVKICLALGWPELVRHVDETRRRTRVFRRNARDTCDGERTERAALADSASSCPRADRAPPGAWR